MVRTVIVRSMKHGVHHPLVVGREFFVYNDAKENWVKMIPPEIGDIKYSVRTDNHVGWLKCDGTAISREAYADLFAIIGTSFGTGNGTTTFNLPDTKGRVLGGVGGGSGLTTRTLGTILGAETHTLTSDEIPSHTHGITDPGHTHTWNRGTEGDDNGSGGSYSEFTQVPGSTDGVIATSSTGISVNTTGGGGVHNNMQPTTFIGNVFIFGVHQVYPY